MGRKSDLSEAVKYRIVYLHEIGKTQLFIAKEVKCSQASVSRVLREYSNNKCFQNKHFKSGRKPVTSRRDERQLKKIVKKHRFRSVRYVHRKWKEMGINVSKSTTLRRLRKLGFRSRVPKIKPFLSSKQRAARVKWCKKGYFGITTIGKRYFSAMKVCFVCLTEIKVYVSGDSNMKLIRKNV